MEAGSLVSKLSGAITAPSYLQIRNGISDLFNLCLNNPSDAHANVVSIVTTVKDALMCVKAQLTHADFRSEIQRESLQLFRHVASAPWLYKETPPDVYIQACSQMITALSEVEILPSLIMPSLQLYAALINNSFILQKGKGERGDLEDSPLVPTAADLLLPPSSPPHIVQVRKQALTLLGTYIAKVMAAVDSASTPASDTSAAVSAGELSSKEVGAIARLGVQGLLEVEMGAPWYFPAMNVCWRHISKLLPASNGPGSAAICVRVRSLLLDRLHAIVRTIRDCAPMRERHCCWRSSSSAPPPTVESTCCLACGKSLPFLAKNNVDAVVRTLRFLLQELRKTCRSADCTWDESSLRACTLLMGDAHRCVALDCFPLQVRADSEDPPTTVNNVLVQAVKSHVLPPLSEVLGLAMDAVGQANAHRIVADLMTAQADSLWNLLLLAWLLKRHALDARVPDCTATRHLLLAVKKHFCTGMVACLTTQAALMGPIVWATDGSPLPCEKGVFAPEAALSAPSEVLWLHLTNLLPLLLCLARLIALRDTRLSPLVAGVVFQLLLFEDPRAHRLARAMLRRLGQWLLIALLPRSAAGFQKAILESLLRCSVRASQERATVCYETFGIASALVPSDVVKQCDKVKSQLAAWRMHPACTFRQPATVLWRLEAGTDSKLSRLLSMLADGLNENASALQIAPLLESHATWLSQQLCAQVGSRLRLEDYSSIGRLSAHLLKHRVDDKRLKLLCVLLLVLSSSFNESIVDAAVQCIKVGVEALESFQASSPPKRARLDGKKASAKHFLLMALCHMLAKLSSADVGNYLRSLSAEGRVGALSAFQQVIAAATTDAPWWLFEEGMGALFSVLTKSNMHEEDARTIIPPSLKEVLHAHIRSGYKALQHKGGLALCSSTELLPEISIHCVQQNVPAEKQAQVAETVLGIALRKEAICR